MNETQAIEAISETFVAGWATGSANLTIGNVNGTPVVTPSAGVTIALDDEALPSVDYFSTLSIFHTTTTILTSGPVGTRRAQRNGYVKMKLWTPADQGRKGWSMLADVARAVLEGASVPPIGGGEPVSFLGAASNEDGADGRWFSGVIRFQFYYFSFV